MLLRHLCMLCRLLMDSELGLEDLKNVHPEVHDSLQKLLVYDGNFEDLGLFFQVTLLGLTLLDPDRRCSLIAAWLYSAIRG